MSLFSAATKGAAKAAKAGYGKVVDNRAAKQDASIPEGGTPAEGPLLTVSSHDHGRNATVEVWPDRVVRIQAAKRTSFQRANQDSEVIALKSITSVQAKKDGAAFTKVTVFASGNTIEYRLGHEQAQRMRDLLTELIVGGAQPTQSLAGPVSLAEELRKLADLRDAGVLSEAEFAIQKTKLLGS